MSQWPRWSEGWIGNSRRLSDSDHGEHTRSHRVSSRSSLHTTMASYTPDSFKPLLLKLVKTPEYFGPDDLTLALEHVLTPDAALPAQIGAFLAALHIERVERRPECLVAAADVLRGRALKAAIEGADKDFVVDMVGTGGDGHNVFNVSTTAAIVAAGAGARVVKVLLYLYPSECLV
jgi:hypothetical protein